MANSMYLNVEGAKGTCKEKAHVDWIEIETYSFGGSQASTQSYGSGAGSGKVSFQDFHFTVKAGKESRCCLASCVQANTSARLSCMSQRRAGTLPSTLLKWFSKTVLSPVTRCRIAPVRRNQPAATASTFPRPSSNISRKTTRAEKKAARSRAVGMRRPIRNIECCWSMTLCHHHERRPLECQ